MGYIMNRNEVMEAGETGIREIIKTETLNNAPIYIHVADDISRKGNLLWRHGINALSPQIQKLNRVAILNAWHLKPTLILGIRYAGTLHKINSCQWLL